MALVPKFVVSRNPEWYSEDGHGEAYACLDSRGLFEAVRDMMVDWARRLPAEEKRCRPQVVYKKIREEVIKEAEALRQKPSRSLLLALMDLVEVLGGNEFGSVATADRAGLKHVLLIYGNYTAYYLPNEELRNRRKKRTVIPVVTQYSEKHNLVRYDARRSMVGTYSVVIPRSENDSRRSYFVQEVLFAPGVKSLKLLREIAGTMFDFWDMTLEMPTHVRALAPSFRQIQSCQLLISDEAGSPGGHEQSEHDTLASHLEEIQPMCCVPEPPDEGSGRDKNKKREASADCFGESQVKCDLTRFEYDKGCGEARLVYFRRSSKVLDGKRGNLLPVVSLRKDQENMRELYVSTTLGFYRALKRSCVKGNGELMSCWNETLQDLGRDTFISGREMCQDIQQSALTAFTKRVNPGAWCNGLPRHVASKISNPTMIEVAELAIALMEGRIPSAFPVAELLYCPIERVRDYLRFRRRYASDPEFRAVVQNKRAGLISAQMREGRMSLADLVALYGKKKMKGGHSGVTASKAAECAEMLTRQPPVDINKIQKMCSRSYSRPESDSRATTPLTAPLTRGQENPVERLQSRGSSAVARRVASQGKGDNSGADEREEDVGVDSTLGGPLPVPESVLYVTPEATPASHWIKNMSTLLMSDPWLNGDEERREAVCALLRLDETLLNRAHSGILGEWVASNRGVVITLRKRGLRDQLSAALIDRLDSLSTERWSEKALLAFPDKAGRRLSHAAPRGETSTFSGHRAASSATSELKKSRPVAERSERRRYHPGGEKRQAGAWKSEPRGRAVGTKGGQMPRRRSGPTKHRFAKAITEGGFGPRSARHKRDRDRMESVFLSEAEEASSEEVEDSESEMELGVRGENLVATADRDDESGSSQDEYDYSDDFIDDGPLETGSSGESSGDDGDGSSGDDACYSTTKRQKVRGLGGRRKKSELVSGRPSSRRGFYSGSEDDDDYPGPITEAADRRDKAPEARYKRAFSSDDSDADESDGKKEGIWRPSKRVKKRDSPSAAHKVVKRRVRGKEPASSHGNRGPGIKSAAAAYKSLGRKHFSSSKRKRSWGAHKTVGGVSGSLQKKQQGGKGDQIKSSPYRFGPSASPSGVTRSTDSSPSRKQKGVRVEEGCLRRSSPASTDRPKRAPVTSSTSSSESESRGYLGASGRPAKRLGRAWSESDHEVKSERRESDGECDTGPARKEEAKRGRGDGAQTDSYGETKECEENPASREEARRERVDKREPVRSERERGGEETASSLRPSRAPAVLRQQSRSSSDSDTGVPRKGGKDGIESEYESWNASDTQRSEDERVDSDADSTGDAACVIMM
ncbi:hypothetical protein Q5P01_000208 [Channa striata]|uniref:Uncharacterized protein n=1 Tax=Channa striata TaxID=64152 RepID=A0AA88ICA8_CHASR|nr:hypothetical protein Q5P01_000208 [Channa striata]